jgi:RNA polymerase sigma-70 factor (ECF subfamily)
MAGQDREQIEALFSEHLRAQRWPQAVEVLIANYGDEILRFLHGFLREGELAEEVFSRVCLKLCEEVPRFRGDCPGRTWFYYQARFAALALVRQERRKPERRLETAEWSRMSALVDQVRSRTRPYLRTEVKNQFQALRDDLDPEERMLLVLYKYQGLNSTQVAEAMSTPSAPWTPAQVRKRWQRLKQKIAELARSRGMLG